MAHFQRAVPFRVEVFTDEPAVTVMGRGFRAKETCSVKHLGLEALLNLAFRQ
jgi:hypothetical protein